MTNILTKIQELEKNSLSLLDQLDAGNVQEEKVRISLRNIIQEAFEFLSNSITHEEYNTIQTFLNSARGLLRVYFRDYVALPFKRPPICTSKDTENLFSIPSVKFKFDEALSNLTWERDDVLPISDDIFDYHDFSSYANLKILHQDTYRKDVLMRKKNIEETVLICNSYNMFKNILDLRTECSSLSDEDMDFYSGIPSYMIPTEGKKLCEI